MSRIPEKFAALRAEGRGALIPFLEAFDPDRDTSAASLRGMPAAGADLIEIGMPFTDPMADGPTIQAAGLRGLAAGATLAGTLDLVREFRAHDNATPIILMGYLNPLLAFGIPHFCARAADAGVDGLIVVDLPTEFLAQIGLVLIGVGILVGRSPASSVTRSTPPPTSPSSAGSTA